MEKYSGFRDAGTGVQPFLPLVPPASNILTKILTPIGYCVGAVRLVLLLAILLVRLAGSVILIIFSAIPPLHRILNHTLTAFTARLALFILGLFWITVDNVTRKRGRSAKDVESWSPRGGDLIVSNWVSWVEVLWLAFRFDPIFVLPVSQTDPLSTGTVRGSDPVTHTPGRRTGTGSANISAPQRAATQRISILGFRQVSLLSMISATGHAPSSTGPYESLDEIRGRSARPVVVFPECTTSNGRGLLRFAQVFRKEIPVKGYSVFVMCVRYDPPTQHAATLAHTIPGAGNPLGHLFSTAASLAPQSVSVRLLAPSESPGSQLFLASEVLGNYSEGDQLSEACAVLIAQMGKMKRTGLGWEDKVRFLDLFRAKERRQ
ncbi:unnamed protein product [Mycena citricolor]|uniref:Phospholipid/glycerol acyltransferase domain-containing protein n=1 Tax=Mycena citricolor TaxID=2018698 RepID=A0AAD2HGQ1_9AGAR|nr:unnamed protein product [Mycena citricolor]